MLKHLLIENYALIEKLDIDLDNGLSTITGETGAGKSIVVGALSLILGQRADTKVLLNKDKKCIVEGCFHIGKYNLSYLFEKNEIDYEDITIIRREINQQGKSRAFVNDTPVNLNVLKTISEYLIDIHSQHESLLINKTYFQFDVIDNFCRHANLRNKYRETYSNYISLKKKLESLLEKEKEAHTNLDYNKFQFEELDKAELEKIPNLNELENELQILNNASEIKQNLKNTYYHITNSDKNILNELSDIGNNLKTIEEYNQKYKDLSERLQSVYIELKDIGDELSFAADEVVFDEEKTILLTEKLDTINKLIMKHNASTINELIKIKESYKKKIDEAEFMEEEIEALKSSVESSKNEVLSIGKKLSDSRVENFPVIEKHVMNVLQNLGMPNARFKIEHKLNDSPDNFGLDTIRFKFNANVGGDLQDISKVASGGEISRLMLSIKSLISESKVLPTIIFDEIDTGVSGEIASRIASIFIKMAKNMQVICITHLPQIASKGQSHFFVYKEVENQQTKTKIKKLENNERIEEVAKMLGGEVLTESARETAKELINYNNNE